jgi:hypothetical protein
MHIAVRQSVVAGVALAGAGAIALSPLQPVISPLEKVHPPAVFPGAGVQLTAGFDPVTPWADLITAAVSNATAIGEEWLADPLPALRQLGTNFAVNADTTVTALGGAAKGAFSYLTTTVPEGFNTVLQQIANGDLSGAAATVNNTLGSAIFTIGLPLFPLLPIPGQMANNFAAVINGLTNLETGVVLPLVVSMLGPLEGGIQAFGDGAQAVLNAVSAGDAAAALNATFGMLPNVLGAVINGYTDTVGNTFPGLLSPEAGGLVYSLAITLPRVIATALGAPAPTTEAKTAAKTAAVATEAQATGDSVSGIEQSKVDTSADSVVSTDVTETVKDGNKFEPARAADATATSPRAAAGKRAASSAQDGKAKSGNSTGKGHSAR